jgi:23S rRNA pseudouridine955/2504/2580 synthase
MNDSPPKKAVSFKTITEHHAGQRIDNFLMRELKNVPRSHVYRIIRKGEVRVNKKRAKPANKLAFGDVVRIPPIHIALIDPAIASKMLLKQLEQAIVLEDEHLLVINKPTGLAVHGGSNIPIGLIEAMRQLRPELPYLELAHRLDRSTSGLVLLAKSRQALQDLHTLFKTGGIDKRYLTFVAGQWQGGVKHIKNELLREHSGRKKVQVKAGGKIAESIFTPREYYSDSTLLEVKLLTGRMHQIRAQLAHLGLPVIGDDQYGDFALNRQYKKTHGIKRLFLHAYRIKCRLPTSGQDYTIEIPLANDLQKALNSDLF